MQIIELKDLSISSEIKEFILAQAAARQDDKESPECPNKSLAILDQVIMLSACYGYQLACSDLRRSFKPDNTDEP